MSNRSKMHDPWGHGAAYVQGAKERKLASRTTGESIMGSNRPNEGASPDRKFLSPAKRAQQDFQRQQVIEEPEPPMLARSTSDRLSVGNSEMMAALSLTRHRSEGHFDMQRKSSFVFEADTRSDHSAGSTHDWGRRRVTLQEQIKEKVEPRLVLMAVCRARFGA